MQIHGIDVDLGNVVGYALVITGDDEVFVVVFVATKFGIESG